jgi:signal transduction histidine kinase
MSETPFPMNMQPGEERFDDLDVAKALSPRRRLEFLNMELADAQRLNGMLDSFRGWADDFVEDFYRHLLSFDETARFLEPPALVRWLKEVQREHFETVLAAQWDDAYFARRRRIGLAHAEIGLEPQYFLGAYNKYVQHSFQHLAAENAEDVDAFKDQALSLLKAIFLDIGLTLDSYFARSTHNLRHALDMYWKANAELRRFAQLTSHDLKTPLATVANLCDEALDEFGEQMPEQAKQLVTAAKDRTFRMSRMIDELLASVVSCDDGQPNEPISVQEVWDEALESFGPLFAQRGIEVKATEPLPRVRGDKALLREVFANLLSNAAKFIVRRPGSVVLTSKVLGDVCELVVADNGPGIPEEDFERLFVPFRRLSAHKDVPGTGLGLYFTKNLVMQQGGRIWITSQRGHGSEFHIELRMARS